MTRLDFGNGIVAGGTSRDAVRILAHSGLWGPDVENNVIENSVLDGGRFGGSRAMMRRVTVRLEFARLTRRQVAAAFTPGVLRTMSTERGTLPYYVEVPPDFEPLRAVVRCTVSMVSPQAYPLGAMRSHYAGDVTVLSIATTDGVVAPTLSSPAYQTFTVPYECAGVDVVLNLNTTATQVLGDMWLATCDGTGKPNLAVTGLDYAVYQLNGSKQWAASIRTPLSPGVYALGFRTSLASNEFKTKSGNAYTGGDVWKKVDGVLTRQTGIDVMGTITTVAAGSFDSRSDLACSPRIIATMPVATNALTVNTAAGATRLSGSLSQGEQVIIDAAAFRIDSASTEIVDASYTTVSNERPIGDGWFASIPVTQAGTHRGVTLWVKESANISRKLTVSLHSNDSASGEPIATTLVEVPLGHNGTVRASWNAPVSVGTYSFSARLLDGTDTSTLGIYVDEAAGYASGAAGTWRATVVGTPGFAFGMKADAASELVAQTAYTSDTGTSQATQPRQGFILQRPAVITALGIRGKNPSGGTTRLGLLRSDGTPITVAGTAVIATVQNDSADAAMVTGSTKRGAEVVTVELPVGRYAFSVWGSTPDCRYSYSDDNPYFGGVATGNISRDLTFKVIGHDTVGVDVYFKSHLMTQAASKLAYFDRTSKWPRLSPGDNVVTATDGQNPPNAVPLTIEWRPRLMGLL